MMNFHYEVIREKWAKLKRHRYWFDVIDFNIRLSYYYEESRPTTRHKYRTDRYYNYYDRRESNIKIENIIIPDDVKNEALFRIRYMIDFKEDKNEIQKS